MTANCFALDIEPFLVADALADFSPEEHFWCLRYAVRRCASTALIIVAAVAGKFGGSAVAARAGGKSWYRSIQIGALMNTRGLTELIVLNVGLDLGLLSKKLFTMLVVMALVATVMTGPILARLRSRAGDRLEELNDVASEVQD